MSFRFGAKKYSDYNKQDQLWDWCAETGQGIMGMHDINPPYECYEFCLSQFQRFNVPIPSCIAAVINEGAKSTMFYLDVANPYLILDGISDVNLVGDWSEYAYEICEDGNRVYEPSPEHIETFRAAPGQAEESFNNILSHPGLDALPGYVGSDLHGMICGTSDWAYVPEEPAWNGLNDDEMNELKAICTDSGGFNEKKFVAYFELAAWGAFAWLVGPLSRSFRMSRHDIMDAALTHGECILVDGCIFAPSYYRRLPRPPESCHVCGIAAWCVELTMTEGSVNRTCEHCLTEGMPRLTSYANCGSKMCLATQCPHNPFHNLGPSGIHHARAAHGQLGVMARGESILRVFDKPVTPQLKGR